MNAESESPSSGKQSGNSCSITQRWAQNAECAVRYVVVDHIMTTPHPVCTNRQSFPPIHHLVLHILKKQSWDAMQNPISHERIHMVPVLRLFGATPAGQKACAFIHGVCRVFLFHRPSHLLCSTSF